MENESMISGKLEKAVYEEYKIRKLYGVALYITKDNYMAEDVVQDSLMKAIEKYPTLKDKEKLHSWLVQIVRTTAINAITKQTTYNNKLIPDDFVENKPSKEMSIEKSVDQKVTQEFMDHHISQLDPKFSQVINLRYKKDATLKEIAAYLDISLGTVKSRLNRSKMKLIEML